MEKETKTFLELQKESVEDELALKVFGEMYTQVANAPHTAAERKLIESVLAQLPDTVEGRDIEAMLESAQNEGVLGGILGGVTGLAFGSKIGQAICKALGITQGPLYQLLTSKLVTTAICTYIGVKA